MPLYFLQFYVPGVVAIKITVMPRIVLRLFVLTSFAVKIKYEDDTFVVLDSYEVIEVATGKVRDVLNWGKEFNTYTIASDLDRGDFAGKEIELQFVGKIGEKIVVTKNYVVSANCCHTYLIKGDEEIVLKERIP